MLDHLSSEYVARRHRVTPVLCDTLFGLSRILVTGAAGFIGSHVAEALVRRGHSVTALDDLSGGMAGNLPARVPFVHGSVTDASLIDDLFARSSFDYVYHLAAYAAEGLSHFIRRFNYTNNVIGSVTLINAAVNTGVRGFVFTSSIAVYGSSPVLPMTERTVPDPEDPYGIAKLAVEQDLRASHGMFGLNYMVFRPHNVYGPRQNIGDRYRNVIGIFMNQILQGRAMTVFGDGLQTRGFSYIADVAPLMAEAIELDAAWNQVFNIGADATWTLNDLAVQVARAMGVEPLVEHLPARLEVLHARASHEKLRSVFGARPETPLEAGLEAMAQWVRRQGPQAGTPFGAIEVSRNLPASWRQA
jgi:UDP-glucose 4-epimerase